MPPRLYTNLQCNDPSIRWELDLLEFDAMSVLSPETQAALQKTESSSRAAPLRSQSEPSIEPILQLADLQGTARHGHWSSSMSAMQWLTEFQFLPKLMSNARAMRSLSSVCSFRVARPKNGLMATSTTSSNSPCTMLLSSSPV